MELYFVGQGDSKGINNSKFKPSHPAHHLPRIYVQNNSDSGRDGWRWRPFFIAKLLSAHPSPTLLDFAIALFRRVTYLTEARFFRTLSLPVSRVIAFNNRQVFFDGFTTAEREERCPHCSPFLRLCLHSR